MVLNGTAELQGAASNPDTEEGGVLKWVGLGRLSYCEVAAIV